MRGRRNARLVTSGAVIGSLAVVIGIVLVVVFNKGTSSADDAQPPTPPERVRTANLTCNAVTLSWSASTDDVGVAFYDVYKDGQQMVSVDGSTLSTQLTVVPGVTWGLYVNGRDAAGNVSQASTTVPVTPPQCVADKQPPTAPTKLAAVALGTNVALTWQPAIDDTGVAAYDVYRNGAKVGSVAGNGGEPPAAAFTDSALAPKTTYRYEVVARDAQANASPRSATATVKTGQACANAICSVTQVAAETDIVWGLTALPDGTVLYNRRDVHDIVSLDPRTGAKKSIGIVPNATSTDGEGGLLGLAIAPSFATDRWLYLFHSSPSDNRIVRIKFVDGALSNGTLQVLVSGIPRNKYHNGGRLRFGPDGKLYAATGDGQNGVWAQQLDNLAGKVLRLNPDGSKPSDNPFGSYVWSYGHRNPQGLAFDSKGRLWEQEFGNSVMDETNLITKGGNYGWPNCEGTESRAGNGCGTSGYLAPKRTYPTAEGSCSGIAVVRDALYVSCLRGTRVYRAVISGTTLTGFQQYFVGTYGRLRTVEPTADGSGLWLATSNGGDKDSTPNNSDVKIMRITLGL